MKTLELCDLSPEVQAEILHCAAETGYSVNKIMSWCGDAVMSYLHLAAEARFDEIPWATEEQLRDLEVGGR
jgi:hypothetical protein